MNKGIKETKSDTKRIKNVSKIVNRVVSDKKRSPTRSKDRSLSMNSLVTCEKSESTRKHISKELKLKMVPKTCDFQKSALDLGCSSTKDQKTTQYSDISKETVEEIEDPSNRKSKINQKQKFLEQLILQEGSIEELLQIKKPTKTVYNVDGMSSTQIRESLNRIDDKTAKPFSFLNDIIDHSEKEKPKMTQDDKDQGLNPTDIDLQLSSLVKRVELNQKLLERANQRIKDINFLTESKGMISVKDMNYDEASFLKMKEMVDSSEAPVPTADLTPVSHPAVEEFQKMMNSTIEMLGYVHRMSSGDLASGEIPSELTDYLNMPITAGENL